MYRKILIPLDGSELAECVLPHVEEIAQGCGVAEVVLFRVCEPLNILADYPASMPANWAEHVEKSEDYVRGQCGLYLGRVEERLKSRGINVSTETALGNAAEAIVDYADKNDIDLIIMANHGRSGPGRWAFGSVADKVFRSTCVPVMMVKAPGCYPDVK